MLEQCNDFINAQHTTNLRITECLARIEQSQKDSMVRLFGGEGQKGVLPYMIEKAEETTNKVNSRIAALERRRAMRWCQGHTQESGWPIASLVGRPMQPPGTVR